MSVEWARNTRETIFVTSVEPRGRLLRKRSFPKSQKILQTERVLQNAPDTDEYETVDAEPTSYPTYFPTFYPTYYTSLPTVLVSEEETDGTEGDNKVIDATTELPTELPTVLSNDVTQPMGSASGDNDPSTTEFPTELPTMVQNPPLPQNTMGVPVDPALDNLGDEVTNASPNSIDYFDSNENENDVSVTKQQTTDSPTSSASAPPTAVGSSPPTVSPTVAPTATPTVTRSPTRVPTAPPTLRPTVRPTNTIAEPESPVYHKLHVSNLAAISRGVVRPRRLPPTPSPTQQNQNQTRKRTYNDRDRIVLI